MNRCRSVAWTFLSESPLRRDNENFVVQPTSNNENDGQECPSYKVHAAKQRSWVACSAKHRLSLRFDDLSLT